MGQVRLPVQAGAGQEAVRVARPAHFGPREETVLDPAVRDTWEISPDLVSLGGPSWALTLEGALDRTGGRALGSRGKPVGSRAARTAGVRTRAVLRPAPRHREERAMIGTLTVTLPSSHTGGESSSSTAGRAPRTAPRGLAVAGRLLRGLPAPGHAGADRLPGRAHVQPAHAGHARGRLGRGPVPELAGCLAEHFSSPEQVRYGSSEPPKRLVYLLDHSTPDAGCAGTAQGRRRERARC